MSLEELNVSGNEKLKTFEKLPYLPQLQILKADRCLLESLFSLPEKCPEL